MSTELPAIKVTDIAEYIRFHSCDRRFKLKYDNYKQVHTDIPQFANLIFNTSLDPVLEAEGRQREKQWAESLEKEGFKNLVFITEQKCSVNWDDFTEKLANLAVGEKAYGQEIEIAGKLGEFNIKGQIDFILIYWQDNQPFLRLVECKASRKDRTYHRVQVAIYKMLLQNLIKKHPLTISGVKFNLQNIECVVVRIDESTNQIQDIIKSSTLNLHTIEADIERLTASDGSLRRIIEKDIDDLDYQLDQKCSDCTLSVHCLAESARKKVYSY